MHFTFAALDIGITDEEKKQMLYEILSLNNAYQHWDKFRNCQLIPIYKGNGIDTKKGKFEYTEAGKQCPAIISVCEKKIFPFMNIHGRVTILRTAPNQSLNVHLDSTKKEIGTLQHKFRLALNGNISKLYFLDKNLNKVHVPSCYDTYIMDGSHPHSLEPDTNEKITLCIGAPWHGESTDQYKELLTQNLYTMKVSRPKTKEIWLDKK